MLAIPDETPPLVRRGLQCLLPSDWPPFLVRLVSEYSGASTRLCHMVRLCLHGMLHDVYCIREGPKELIVITPSGIVLRVPSNDGSVIQWPVDPDTNLRTQRSLNPEWFATILEPRTVGSLIPFPSNAPSAAAGAGARSTLHVRLRCLQFGELPEAPMGPPFFVYLKYFSPWMLLRGLSHAAVSSMREGSVLTTLIPHCRPLSPAPITYYYSTHEETGSCTAVHEDLTARMLTESEVRPCEALASRVMGTLALLHGRFMVPVTTDAASTRNTSPPRHHEEPTNFPVDRDQLPEYERILRGTLVHPMIFFSQWQSQLDITVSTTVEDGAAKEAFLAKQQAAGKKGMYTPPPPASAEAAKFGVFFPEEALRQLYHCEIPNLVVAGGSQMDSGLVDPNLLSFASQRGARSGDEGPDDEEPPAPSPIVLSGVSQLGHRSSSAPIWTATKAQSLTLIHGSLHSTQHIAVSRNAKGQRPSCLLLDWKHAGIGPAEVDILDVMCSCLTEQERGDATVLRRLLNEYSGWLSDIYGAKRSVLSLMLSCRDVARLRSYSKTRSEGFVWGAVHKRAMIAIANTLELAICAEASS